MKSQCQLGLMKHMAQKQENLYVKESIDFLSQFMQADTFEQVYLSFNGGKDATVIFFLTLIALENSSIRGQKLKCLYFQQPDSFEQINEFIQKVRDHYPIEWHELGTKNYQKQLTQFCSLKPVKYIIMGSRKDDPHCQNLTRMSPSDVTKGYPHFFRLNPIIEWNYEQVWTFLKGFKLPFCKLYNEGYTYLGNKKTCMKNPSLFDAQSQKYMPASQGHSDIEKNSRFNHKPDIVSP